MREAVTVKVRATGIGYYGNVLRKAGEEFEYTGIPREDGSLAPWLEALEVVPGFEKEEAPKKKSLKDSIANLV